MPCKGGQERIPKDIEVIFVKEVDEIIRAELGGFPFCGNEHIRTYAQQRGLDFDKMLMSQGMTVNQTDHTRKVRQAWMALEAAAEQAETGRLLGSR